jgi:hypothetical protein
MNTTTSSLRVAVRPIIFLLVIMALAVALAGCTKPTTKTSTSSSTSSTGTKPSAASVAAKDLKVLKGDAPGTDITDLARYSGAVRQSDTIVAGANGKQSGVLIYQTANDVASVVDYYTSELNHQDWTVIATVITNDGKILQATKGSRNVSINIARRQGIDFTDIVIQYREF